MTIADDIKVKIAKAAGIEVEQVKLEHPEREEFGDYSTNIALILKGGRQLAEKIAGKIKEDEMIKKVEVAGSGFINVWLQTDVLSKSFDSLLIDQKLRNKKIMVEFAHPNTHKELHIGHMRTLITGEALSRILTAVGATVFRANYQGDVGPHVAKSIWGTQKLLEERKLSWSDVNEWDALKRAHLLGEGYVKGSGEYEANKVEIDELNTRIYQRDEQTGEVYQQTRRWSLDYYDTFYKRFGTKFDRLYFESEVDTLGKKLVEEQVGKIFEKSEGAIIFDGERYGLHKRVFVTAAGNPTYEAKDMALAPLQFSEFQFDTCIHIVANEQASYFQVIIKALELLDPKFKGREFHLSMGMVQLVGQKMSSRTGVIMTVDGLLDEVKSEVVKMINREDKSDEEVGEIAEKVTLGAVKYSVLKTHPTLNTAFDIKTSITVDGNSGPYLQYTYARTKSVLAKNKEGVADKDWGSYEFNSEEMAVLRYLIRFPEVVEEAAIRYAPNLVCNYLYELAQKYNSFYNQHSVLSADNSEAKSFRLAMTKAVGEVLKDGLNLLGIAAPERM